MNSAFCVAVHALICLNRRQEQLSSEELARSICTNPARVRKIMAGLKRAGLVETKEGNEGGYRFVGDPAALTLDQVARALEVRFVSTNWRGGGVDQPCLEASGMLEVMDGLLEELDHALARGAKIYAEVLGYGATCDAYHMTAPRPDGSGGARAMALALADGGVSPEQVDYINAHGTSTHLNDSGETTAVKTVFGDHAYHLMMSSTKSMTGHTLGAAGAIEAIFTALSLHHGFVPATINYQVPDPECDLDVVPNTGRTADIRYALSNSLGFGGHNGSILFKKWEE